MIATDGLLIIFDDKSLFNLGRMTFGRLGSFTAISFCFTEVYNHYIWTFYDDRSPLAIRRTTLTESDDNLLCKLSFKICHSSSTRSHKIRLLLD
ncbi:hypothetical protein TNCV_3916831 [Trichonephila clavipes]|nr:hypothetical protein TNCV_3916831 [Trichonephila clavipes]